MKKLLLFTLISLISITVISQSCLPDGIEFTTQEQIDNFQTNYPGCTQIEGDVTIDGGWLNPTNITNLSGLNVITSIGGDLDLNALVYLQGLSGLNNLNSIGGRLQIGFWGNGGGGTSLTSLAGLEGLDSIGGGVGIVANSQLTDISALNGLTYLGGSLLILLNNSLAACQSNWLCDYLSNPEGEVFILDNAPGCNSIVEVGSNCNDSIPCLPYGHYWLRTQEDIDNFQNVFPGCTALEGDFTITPSWMGKSPYSTTGSDILNLNGLNVITSIGGGLFIIGNGSLTTLTGLNQLNTIGGDLSISCNDILTSLQGLDNIDAASVANLYIQWNNSLSICEVESVCNYLAAPNGGIEICINAPGCNSQEEVEEACLSHCLPEGITFTTQAQIDSFQINYPDCTEIEGNVIIQGDDITNLNGLSIIKQFSGNLRIGMEALAVGNPLLVNLSGLENVTYVGGDMEIMYNESLNSITALESLSFIKGSLRVGRCNNLYSLEGLNSLDTVGGLGLSWIWSLENLSGLENLKFIDGALEIVMCNNLRDLSELSNLVSINGGLWISNNWILNSLSGLNNISAASINDIFINANDSLSECDIRSICEYLIAPNGDADFINNAPGCNSSEEVEEACASSIQEIDAINTLSVTPIPFTTSTTLSYTLKQPSTVQLSIYNQLGQLVYQRSVDQLQGEQNLQWDAQDLAEGVYYYRLKVGDAVANGKMVKVR